MRLTCADAFGCWCPTGQKLARLAGQVAFQLLDVEVLLLEFEDAACHEFTALLLEAAHLLGLGLRDAEFVPADAAVGVLTTCGIGLG